ncbi:hypothetical protein [Winogradskyella endarachnes]|uniref:Uncharacterized protein n=1 Tax=Winogradskyella endarachnes TaxID=2681965 RepID=A0A6L6UFC4_9FLAO|nr:hypothetical protein [Winogradskyella endarachnes]MUU79544.1 hypothetical protein [Winogradskyella endarachnes]
MLKKNIISITCLLLTVFSYAQKSINNYKYIIIPKEFSFSKSEDQYQLNSLTKFLFNKHGYEAYFIDELPENVKADRCNALNVNVSKEKSNMFKTKIEITLKDCYDAVVMTSKVGESRLKVYNKAYTEALRDAFETYKNFNYKYSGENKIEEFATVKNTAEPVKEEDKVIVEKTVKPQLEATVKPIPEKVSKKEEIDKAPTTVKRELFYAQEIENGYQLVNSEPKVVMILLNTAAIDVYLVKGKSAIVFKEDGFWYYSENNGTLREKETLNIKF